MKKIFIYPNLSEKRYIEKVIRAISVLRDKGHICVLNRHDGILLYGEGFKEAGRIEDCDLIVSLGGDGTFLRGCQLALKHDLPICGINCGNLGFLCVCQLNKIDELDIDSLNESKLSLLKFKYNDKDYNALNEVVIGKDYFGGTVELEYSVNDLYRRFRGDGLIVCTATGSTAYNVSAGGSPFKENDSLIGITAICPHTGNIDPLTVSDSNRVKIKLVDQKYSASIFADGIFIGKLDQLVIEKSDQKVRVLRNS